MKVANRFFIVSTESDEIVSRHKTFNTAEKALIKLLEDGENDTWRFDAGEKFLIAEAISYGTTEARVEPLD